MLRRRKGATLGLVAVCVLVIVVVGVGVYFLAKILGGGREIANATDAGTLNVAKHIIRDCQVPTGNYPEFADCEYPLGCGYINLLTYNRCVAKAMLIGFNAENMVPPPTSLANVNKLFSDLDAIGAGLLTQIRGANSYFNQVTNTTRMASPNGVKAGAGQLGVAYMKPGGSTNIFFAAGQTALIGKIKVDPPSSQTTLSPQNESSYATQGGGYMAGYTPISVLGHTLYGVPVFPQQNPHLVSLSDFNNSQTTFGTAPPNSVEVGGETTEQKTNMLTGAIACAIVGATTFGSPGSGGGTVGKGLLGSGFQFPAASSFGYIEFGNYPANPQPPGYDPADYQDNIFNNELYLDKTFTAAGDAGQNSLNVAFARDQASQSAWLTWAKNGADTSNYPPLPNEIFVGAKGSDLRQVPGSIPAVGITKSNPPSQTQINIMKQIAAAQLPGENCYTELDNGPLGLVGSCVASIGAMQATFKHNVPALTPATGSQNFSQADWAKATLLTAFEGKNPQNPGNYNNQTVIDLTTGAPVSGLGLYPANLVPGKVPEPPPYMQVPQTITMPLQKPGSIYDLIKMVQDPNCMAVTIGQIAERAKQIQPQTSDADVQTLLQSQVFPMAPHGPTPSWQSANKLYMYLPNGDLSAKLILSGAPPPKLTGNAPDGCCTAPDTSNACYYNQYGLNTTIVDSQYGGSSLFGDQMVHDKPFTLMNPTGYDGLYVIDHADWQPGSGADFNFGRVTFQEIGIGSTTFWHIN